ncbi:hypothetical protein BaRGS_00015227, partial [Batillaria attramentaria]
VLKLGQINLYPSWSTRWCDEVMLCGRAPLSLRIFVMESTVNRTYDVIQQRERFVKEGIGNMQGDPD